MQIQQTEKRNKQIFYIGEADSPLAEMVFSLPAPGKMVVEHTEVNESLEGKGVGKLLVAHAVDYAREHQLKLIPLCPFTKAVIDRTPKYQDVLS